MKNKILILAIICLSSFAHANYKVEVVTLKPQPTLAKSVQAKPEQAGEIVGKTLGELEAFAKKNKIELAGAPYVKTFEWSQNSWKFEAGFPVSKKLNKTGEGFISSELPGGKTAKTVHIGPTEGTEAAYKEVEAWIAKNKKEKRDAPWEVYLNSSETTKPSELKTEIFFPIR